MIPGIRKAREVIEGARGGAQLWALGQLLLEGGNTSVPEHPKTTLGVLPIPSSDPSCPYVP